MPYSDSTISANIAYEYNDRPLKGLDGGRAMIINYDDIDFATTPRTGAAEVSAFTLKSGGKQAYEIQFYKELASTNSVYTPNEEDVDGFTHSFSGRMSNANAANAGIAQELKDGRFVVIVETKYKGDDATPTDAFKIYGLDSGLKLSEMTYNSNENNGGVLFTLATPEGMSEEFPYVVLNDTDYATTLALVEALTTPTA